MEQGTDKKIEATRLAKRAKRAERRAARKAARQAFLRSFRWAVYITFIVFMAFVGVCTIVGIVTNLREPHPELDIPVTRPASLADLDSQDLNRCLQALTRLSAEEAQRVQAMFSPELNRDQFLSEYQVWAGLWRKRFEQLGMTCRLNENAYSGLPALGTMAQFYSRLDHRQRQHQRLVKRYALENGRTLQEMFDLLKRAEGQLENQGTPPSQP